MDHRKKLQKNLWTNKGKYSIKKIDDYTLYFT